MILAELEIELNNLKLSYRNYSLLSTYLEDGFCMAKRDDVWEVYYCERGHKNVVGTFTSESDACEYFYDRFKKKSKKFCLW